MAPNLLENIKDYLYQSQAHTYKIIFLSKNLRLDMAQTLLESGAKQISDLFGNFPLHSACVTGNKWFEEKKHQRWW